MSIETEGTVSLLGEVTYLTVALAESGAEMNADTEITLPAYLFVQLAATLVEWSPSHLSKDELRCAADIAQGKLVKRDFHAAQQSGSIQ